MDYIEPPTIPDGMTIADYRRARRAGRKQWSARRWYTAALERLSGRTRGQAEAARGASRTAAVSLST